MVDQADQLRRLMGKAQPALGPTMIAVASGKGGVGKSMISVNLALALCKRGKRALIIDADFGLANVDLMLGVQTKYNLAHVLARKATVQDTIMTSHYGVQFISGGSGMDELLHMDETHLAFFVDSFLQMGDIADMIVLDMGAGVSDKTMALLAACDETIVVTSPEPTALLDAYALVKSASRLPEPPKLNLIVNRAESVNEGMLTLRSFDAIVQKYLNMPITQLGYILQDRAVMQAVREQVPLLVRFPSTVASQNIERIADQYLRQPETRAESGWARFFGKLMQRGAKGGRG